MNQTKITVKIFEPLLMAFDNQLDRLFIKRDAFLNHMIRTEINHLAEEMKDIRLSSNARRYISQQLKLMGTKTINVVVDKETADALNTIVDKCNIVRDAFLNRLIAFLRSSDQLLTYLELPNFIVPSQFESYLEAMPTSPLGAMESVFSDPLYYLRTAAQERFNSGIYLLDLPAKMDGFSCFMSDLNIPGTKEFSDAQVKSDEWLNELLKFESEAFSP